MGAPASDVTGIKPTMISHEHHFIFVHIPKCAGSSIEWAYGHTDGKKLVQEQDHRSIRMLQKPVPLARALMSSENIFHLGLRLRYRLQKHRNPNNKVYVTTQQYKNYFKFCIVRNPWARAYSWYKNCLRNPVHRKQMMIRDSITLYEFLRKFVGQGSLRSQLSWITDFNGQIPLDYIARFESLETDFENIRDAVDAPLTELPHTLRGSGEDYRQMFDNSSIELVRDFYHKEIELFGYDFEY